MIKFNKEEQLIFKRLYKTYTLPLCMGFVSSCQESKTPKGNDFITYSLGFKTKDLKRNQGRKMLVRSAELTPLQIIQKINYILYIKSIEYHKTKEEEICQLRLGIDYSENNF